MTTLSQILYNTIQTRRVYDYVLKCTFRVCRTWYGVQCTWHNVRLFNVRLFTVRRTRTEYVVHCTSIFYLYSFYVYSVYDGTMYNVLRSTPYTVHRTWYTIPFIGLRFTFQRTQHLPCPGIRSIHPRL